MKNSLDATRYLATDEMRRQLRLQGRKASWVAAQLGISRPLMSKVMSGQRTISGRDAQMIAALLGVDFFSLFKVPIGTLSVHDSNLVEEQVA